LTVAVEAPQARRPDPAPPYPAPYVEPWGRLAFDLRAALASAGLRLRELARRNRQGDLSVPGFWPASLAWLFWPLLLGLVVTLVVTLGGNLVGSLAPSADSKGAPEAALFQQPLQESAQEPEPQPVSPAQGQAEPPAPLAIDPLLALLADDDPQGCITVAQPHPLQRQLDLELAPTFLTLPAPLRQQQADQWLERSRELGYERLRLIDAAGDVWAQAARVGSGMVLLGPAAL